MSWRRNRQLPSPLKRQLNPNPRKFDLQHLSRVPTNYHCRISPVVIPCRFSTCRQLLVVLTSSLSFKTMSQHSLRAQQHSLRTRRLHAQQQQRARTVRRKIIPAQFLVLFFSVSLFSFFLYFLTPFLSISPFSHAKDLVQFLFSQLCDTCIKSQQFRTSKTRNHLPFTFQNGSFFPSIKVILREGFSSSFIITLQIRLLS